MKEHLNFIDAMHDAMRQNGFNLNGNINTQIGVYHCFTSDNSNCKKNCCRYRIFENQQGAHFCCWRRQIDFYWFFGKKRKLSLNDRSAINAERAKQHQLQQEKQIKAKEAVIKRLSSITTNLQNANAHPYVIAKQITPYGAVANQDKLYILILDINYQIQTYQTIMPNGVKKMAFGAPAKNGMAWLCPKIPLNYTGKIYLCEGWATGCTISDITGWPTICALNASNLIKVASLLRYKYLYATLIICADNDKWGGANVGLEAGEKAARLTESLLIYPEFNDEFAISKPTDFNDAFKIFGLDALTKKLGCRKSPH